MTVKMEENLPAPDGLRHSPPVLRGHNKAFIYQTIQRLILLVAGFSLVVNIIFILIGDWRLTGPISCILVTQLLGYFFLRAKQLAYATILIPVGIFIGTTLSAVFVPQYYALFPGFYGLTIVVAGALIGKRAAWLTAVASLVCGLFIFLYQNHLGLPFANSPIYLALSGIQIILFTIVSNLMLFYMNRNYERLTASYAALEQAQRDLRHHTNDLKIANIALRQSRQTKQAILDSIPDMMAIMNRHGDYLDYKALSYFREEDPPESVIGKNVYELLSPDMAAKRLERINNVLDSQEVLEYEESQYARTELRHFATRIMAINDKSVLVMMRDITREKEREQIELATQKLESIGLLAGGIAHDFNNLLTGMMAQTSLALYKLDDDHPAVRHIKKANTATERAADLTRQLLAYTGQGHFELSQVNVNDILRENVEFLQAGLPRPVHIDLHLTPDLSPITADEGQIQQLVMNLIINAAEASPQDDAHITIHTAVCTREELINQLTQRDHPLPTLTSDNYLCLTIADEGIGMSPETVQKIFDPFFTTKEQGRGLGLSAIWGIIRSYHGTIQVDSTEGKGTTFTIYLPTEGQPETINLSESLTAEQLMLPPRPSRPAPQTKKAGPA